MKALLVCALVGFTLIAKANPIYQSVEGLLGQRVSTLQNEKLKLEQTLAQIPPGRGQAQRASIQAELAVRTAEVHILTTIQQRKNEISQFNELVREYRITDHNFGNQLSRTVQGADLDLLPIVNRPAVLSDSDLTTWMTNYPGVRQTPMSGANDLLVWLATLDKALDLTIDSQFFTSGSRSLATAQVRNLLFTSKDLVQKSFPSAWQRLLRASEANVLTTGSSPLEKRLNALSALLQPERERQYVVIADLLRAMRVWRGAYEKMLEANQRLFLNAIGAVVFDSNIRDFDTSVLTRSLTGTTGLYAASFMSNPTYQNLNQEQKKQLAARLESFFPNLSRDSVLRIEEFVDARDLCRWILHN